MVDACSNLAAGERGLQHLQGTALVKSVRQHRRAAFLDVSGAANSTFADILQVVVPLERDEAHTELLKPGILLSLRGAPGRTRRGQASLFADDFSIAGVAAG